MTFGTIDELNAQPHYKYYTYDPSFPGAVVMAILFLICTSWHLFLVFKHKTWYFIPCCIGGIFEIVGYAARGASNKQAPNPTIAPYIITTLLLLVAPALFAASIYMILGRIIISVDGESLSPIRKRWLTKIFVTSDVITFIVQLGGGGLEASTTPATAQMGSNIILAGLCLQIVIFSLFISVAVLFQRRLRAMPTSRSYDPTLPWEKYIYLLYVTCGFILARSIVRVAEFVEGYKGTIITHEWYLYVFDGVPMMLVMIAYGVMYPSQFSTRSQKAFVDRGSAGSNIELEVPYGETRNAD